MPKDGLSGFCRLITSFSISIEGQTRGKPIHTAEQRTWPNSNHLISSQGPRQRCDFFFPIFYRQGNPPHTCVRSKGQTVATQGYEP